LDLSNTFCVLTPSFEVIVTTKTSMMTDSN
jgi:hypothetical protein